jgi:hypothetical protein
LETADVNQLNSILRSSRLCSSQSTILAIPKFIGPSGEMGGIKIISGFEKVDA